MRKFAVGIIAVALFVIISVVAGTKYFQSRNPNLKPLNDSASAASAASDATGQNVPEAVLKNVVTQSTVNLKDFKGKVVLINFWASWCEACMNEMPSLIKLNNILKDEGFALVSINLDENQEKVVPQVISELHINFPVYNDSEEQLVKTFNVVALPFNVIIDKTQKIIRSESGERDWASDAIIQEFRTLLKSP